MSAEYPSTTELLEFALDAVALSGRVALAEFGTDVAAKTSVKLDGMPVTETDIKVERLLRNAIAQRFPEHTAVGEEFGGGEIDDAAGSWLIDPIDGTSHFARGEDGWGCSFRLSVRVASKWV